MKKIFCFDMDMTLLDHKSFEIPQSAMESLSQLRQKGHLIAICSGRDMESEFSRDLARRIGPDAIVHCNGLKVTVGEQKIYEEFMETEQVEALLNFGKEHHICVGYNVGLAGCYVHPEVLIEREKKSFGSCDREFIDPAELLKIRLHSMAMFGSCEQAKEIEEAFPDLKLLMFSENAGADIIRRGTSKAVGIEALLKYYGLEWKDVVAFGDSRNDLEMIRMAGTGIAMGNAVDLLKSEADFVTRPVDEDGVRYGLLHYQFL